MSELSLPELRAKFEKCIPPPWNKRLSRKRDGSYDFREVEMAWTTVLAMDMADATPPPPATGEEWCVWERNGWTSGGSCGYYIRMSPDEPFPCNCPYCKRSIKQ